MTSYAPNYTPRMRLKYVAGGIEHTIMMRGPRGASAAALDAQKGSIRACFNFGAARLMDDFAWLSAEYALTDDDVFYPTTLPAAVVGAIPIVGLSAQRKVQSTNFNGRVAGSRAAIYFYGFSWEAGFGQAAENGRITPAEEAFVTSIANELSGQAHAGNGLQAIFHQYANVKVNDHLLKLLRRGII